MNYTEHDPLCTAVNKSLISPNICSPCQLIRAVREDIRANCKCDKDCC